MSDFMTTVIEYEGLNNFILTEFIHLSINVAPLEHTIVIISSVPSSKHNGSLQQCWHDIIVLLQE